MRTFERPKIIVSRCLEFDACRYDGAMISSPAVRMLMAHVDFVPVCPEVEIGLGVPRHPIRIVKIGGSRHLIQPETGRDVTDDMVGFVDTFLAGVEDTDGFILKFRSPSCGLKGVKVYAGMEKRAAAKPGPGFFGGPVVERFSHLAVEDEGRLTNFKIREHFLTKVFALAAFRRVKAAGTMRDLVRFQTENKLLLMACSQKALRSMGRLVANPAGRPVRKVIQAYESDLLAVLARPPRGVSSVNVLMHALGYFSKHLSHREKAFFLDSLQEYRDERVPLSVPVGIIRSYVVRFEEQYLAQQTFFEPYPAGLVSVADSGKGRPDRLGWREMAEGPLVHFYARQLRKVLKGRRVEVTFGVRDLKRYEASLRGLKINDVEAYGKQFRIRLADGRVILVHLMMWGSWRIFGKGEPWDRPRSRARLILATGTHQVVAFSAPVVRLLSEEDLKPGTKWGDLGPDPLRRDFSGREFWKRLAADPKRPVGEALLDQKVISGVGNILRIEILHASRIHPKRPAGSLSPAEKRRLLGWTVRLMKKWLDERGSEDTWIKIYRRRGEPCPRCGVGIDFFRQGGRITYACPGCQA